MFKEEQMFCVMLEDYYYPRTASVVKAYYGTLEDIQDLADCLLENEGTERRYRELISGVEQHDGTEEHVNIVAGTAYPLLMPMAEVYRHAFVLTDYHWFGIGYSGAYGSFSADQVAATQILLKTGSGYRRCLKASFANLRTCIPNWGWIRINGAVKGFPGVVTHEGNTTSMNLFIDQQYYTFEDFSQAVADATDPTRIDLAAVMGDILGAT